MCRCDQKTEYILDETGFLSPCRIPWFHFVIKYVNFDLMNKIQAPEKYSICIIDCYSARTLVSDHYNENALVIRCTHSSPEHKQTDSRIVNPFDNPPETAHSMNNNSTELNGI